MFPSFSLKKIIPTPRAGYPGNILLTSNPPKYFFQWWNHGNMKRSFEKFASHLLGKKFYQKDTFVQSHTARNSNSLSFSPSNFLAFHGNNYFIDNLWKYRCIWSQECSFRKDFNWLCDSLLRWEKTFRPIHYLLRLDLLDGFQ